MPRRITNALLGITGTAMIVLGALTLLGLLYVPAVGQTPAPVWLSRLCKYEDSANCFWNAGTTGNGRGHSFYAVLTRTREVCLLYTDDRYAKHHNHCISDTSRESVMHDYD